MAAQAPRASAAAAPVGLSAAAPAATARRRATLVVMEGGNPVLDAVYVLGCLGALFFAFKNVFDSVFFENE
eukprot:1035112-Prymnesium_polylepis.1